MKTLEEITEEDLMFACTCSVSHGEGEDETLTLIRDWAETRYYEEQYADFFITRMLHDLDIYWASIAIATDQWMGIFVQVGMGKDKEPEGFVVQCDRFEDGLMYVLYRLYLRFGDRRDD